MSGNALDEIVDSLSAGRIGMNEFMQAIEDEVQVLEQTDEIQGEGTYSLGQPNRAIGR